MTVICYLIASVAFIYCINKALYKYGIRDKARWYLLHCIVNIIIVVLTLKDVYIVLSTPSPIFLQAHIMPSIITMALHLFHGMGYTLNADDIMHHGVMLSLITIPLYHTDNPYFIGITNYCLFFLSGLPGGIDYYLMYLVETDRLSKLTEKLINKHLNSWIRSIGILYGAFIIYQSWLSGLMSINYMIPTVIILAWNAQYYNSQVSASYGRSGAPLHHSSLRSRTVII